MLSLNENLRLWPQTIIVLGHTRIYDQDVWGRTYSHGGSGRHPPYSSHLGIHLSLEN